MSRNCSSLASVFDPINFNSMEIEEDEELPLLEPILNLRDQNQRYSRSDSMILSCLPPNVVDRNLVLSDQARRECGINNELFEHMKRILSQGYFGNEYNQLTPDTARLENDIKVGKDDEYTELEQKMADKYYEQMKNEKPENVGRFVILKIGKEGEEVFKREPAGPSECSEVECDGSDFAAWAIPKWFKH